MKHGCATPVNDEAVGIVIGSARPCALVGVDLGEMPTWQQFGHDRNAVAARAAHWSRFPVTGHSWFDEA